jgi:hypothetical protein
VSEPPCEQNAAEPPATGELVFEPITADTLERIRAAGVDEAGNRLRARVDAGGGSPLRCCLRESAPGERVLLISYTPPGGKGAYAERGPVFIHAEPCGGYRTPGRYPPGLSHRQQVVRAYDEDGRIAGGVLAGDGEQAMAAIHTQLARPGVALVQLRNVGFGCYNFAVRRAGGPSPWPGRKRNLVGDPAKSLVSRANTHSGRSAKTLFDAGSTASGP